MELGNFSTDLEKNTEISNFIKIRPVGDELFHEDRRTDMTKLIVTFPIFWTRLMMLLKAGMA
jgi:hypothetical protein